MHIIAIASSVTYSEIRQNFSIGVAYSVLRSRSPAFLNCAWAAEIVSFFANIFFSKKPFAVRNSYYNNCKLQYEDITLLQSYLGPFLQPLMRGAHRGRRRPRKTRLCHTVKNTNIFCLTAHQGLGFKYFIYTALQCELPPLDLKIFFFVWP